MLIKVDEYLNTIHSVNYSYLAAYFFHFMWLISWMWILYSCCFGFRKATKESLVQTSSDITENLMSISRMMSQQVQQSEETIGTLGKRCHVLISEWFISLMWLLKYVFTFKLQHTFTCFKWFFSPFAHFQPHLQELYRRQMKSLKLWQAQSIWGENSFWNIIGVNWPTNCWSF